ncbi:hypothetical protein MIND_01165300 [Mycena indigotica]|uniref:Uncharacterized protein n=1 Tax=Mycena indigotica TaxID=2126181 RepID=A0A8H6S4J3_9AGAR|nr:uncharacterized protein MIND_01165300 [Mycena indigotica]KAF7292671.1 hypothetical protein MIND_01165300 [Mycena indigotica]
MPAVFSTLAGADHPRLRKNAAPRQKPAPRPAAAQREQRATHAARQKEMDDDVAKWWADTQSTAKHLAEKYQKKERYFYDLFFQGGAHMVHSREAVNPYNAFKHEKAIENQKNGVKENVEALHEAHHAEYQQLSEEEKNELVERLRKEREENVVLRRDTPKARAQDVANTARNITQLITALARRVGLDAFFCLFRNNPDFAMEPYWWFSNKAVEEYMPIATRKTWNTGEVGFKLEAFAIAGCDALNLLRTSKQKSDWLKAEIRILIKEKLVAITGNPDAEIAYRWFEEDVVQRYDIVIDGWCGIPFDNPSAASTSLAKLRETVDGLRSGTIVFRKLTLAEAAERRKKWEADVAAGLVSAKSQKERSDKGVPRKRKHAEMAEGEVNGNGEGDSDADDDGVTEPASRPKRKPRRQATGKENTMGGKANKGKATQRDDAVTRAAVAKLKAKKVLSPATIEDSGDDEV